MKFGKQDTNNYYAAGKEFAYLIVRNSGSPMYASTWTLLIFRAGKPTTPIAKTGPHPQRVCMTIAKAYELLAAEYYPATTTNWKPRLVEAKRRAGVIT